MGLDEQAIREVHATWIEAVNAADIERLLTLMADDVVFLNPGRAPFGRDGFAPVFLGAHEQFVIRCVSEPVEVTVAADMACTISRDSLTITPRAGGETGHLAGDRMTIYRKQADGRWLLARDLHTLA